jgi:hypothetical protein
MSEVQRVGVPCFFGYQLLSQGHLQNVDLVRPMHGGGLGRRRITAIPPASFDSIPTEPPLEAPIEVFKCRPPKSSVCLFVI